MSQMSNARLVPGDAARALGLPAIDGDDVLFDAVAALFRDRQAGDSATAAAEVAS